MGCTFGHKALSCGHVFYLYSFLTYSDLLENKSRYKQGYDFISINFAFNTFAKSCGMSSISNPLLPPEINIFSS